MIDLNNVTRLLDSNRLKEALQELHFLSTTIQDWQLQTDIEEVQTAYTYMLQYMKQGVEDPNRKEFYNKLTQKAYKLKDRLYIAHASKVDNSHFFETVRSKSKNPGRSFEDILNLLELHAEQSFYFSPEQKKAQFKQHDKALVELFEKAWTLSIWNEGDTEKIGKYLSSILIPDADLALLVSAVTMSMIRTFDVNKLIFLCDAYDHEYVITSQRALVGIAITILYHDDRICKDSKAMEAIKRLKKLTFFHRELHKILMQLLLTRETQKIDKKMREEIIPGIQKATKLKNKRFGMEDIEEFDENNPDWEEMLRGSDVEKQVKELGELQMSGADLYMSSFSQLKHYAFFHDMAHWFFQFDTDQIDFTTLLGNQHQEDNLLKVLLDIPTFCNSDKYSFYYTLTGLNDTQRSIITEQFNLQKEQLSEEQSSMLAKVSKKGISEEDASRQYIHDLYRFFKLWRNRTEEVDIFTNSFHLWECNCLSDIFVDHKELKEIADYFLKNDYPKEAAVLYEKVVKICFTEAEYWQKAGYAFQKQKEYKKAIEYYLQADIVKPDSLWVNKNLAQCYRKIGEIESALTYYKNIATLEPDNLSTILQTGYCLVELQQYEEALPYFFKVEYYDKNPIKAQRAIGWCYFVLGKYTDAIKKLVKVTESEKATQQDWLNIGHAYYANKEVVHAINSYQKASDLSKNRDIFVATFLADQPILAHHNFTEEELYLLLDQLS